MAVEVRFKRLGNGGGLDLPRYETPGSAGADIQAAVDDDLALAPGARALIPAGFALTLPPGYEAQVRPRSGLAVKHGLTVLNAPGTIDSDYRGEVKVPLINLGKQSFQIEWNMRIAQMLITPVPRTQWIEVDELSETQRGDGGFGHTGH